MPKKHLQKVIGLMSGTSADGADAALIATDGENEIEFFGGLTLPYDNELRARVLEASQHDVPLLELARVERDITLHHANAVAKLIDTLPKESEGTSLIGFHGHTVRHVASEGIWWQISNPWLLAEKTGMRVVSDFRRNDVAAGGQGAPLVAMFHRALFAKESRPTVILNLGGVANITWLGESEEIIAGDTGPGCGLLDEWIQEMAGLSHDIDGRIALQGKVNDGVVAAALATPFFSKPLPRSADRFDFDHVDVSGMSVEDGAATLCAVTVRAIVKAVKTMPKPPAVLWVTGGGVHHPVIMRMLTDHFGKVQNVRQLNLNPDTLEAECFAWLAVRHTKRLPLTIPETTGCSRPVCGGSITC
ncbi:MAG TPA: anhydro-N-acetylmuramic acid kinase [Lacipirellulaceae bacterium]|nr:anhydro-N-acetylmuramic acid kinase [Lacipirellulaceae bacterium]